MVAGSWNGVHKLRWGSNATVLLVNLEITTPNIRAAYVNTTKPIEYVVEFRLSSLA